MKPPCKPWQFCRLPSYKYSQIVINLIQDEPDEKFRYINITIDLTILLVCCPTKLNSAVCILHSSLLRKVFLMNPETRGVLCIKNSDMRMTREQKHVIAAKLVWMWCCSACMYIMNKQCEPISR